MNEQTGRASHGGVQPLRGDPYGRSFDEGGPLERNIGFSDGHVKYYKKQTRGE